MKKIFTLLVLLTAMTTTSGLKAQCTLMLIDTPAYICKDSNPVKNVVLAFSGSTETPNRYDISWGPEAAGTGFVNRTNQSFSTTHGMIGISVPMNQTPEGTYHGTLRVYAAAPNTCVATTYTFRVIVRAAVATPAPFTVSTERVCAGSTGVPYTVPFAADPDPAASYRWSYTGSGVVINGSGNSVTLDFSNNATAGELLVARSATCETFVRHSSNQWVAIEVDNGAPGAPGPFVDHAESVCEGRQYMYSVPHSGVTYLWNYTGTGASITPNENFAFVQFNNGASDGNIVVRAINSCDTSAEYNLPVTVETAIPSLPGSFITATDKICQEQEAVYQLPRVPGVNYQWAYLATGATISGPDDSVSIYYDQFTQSGILEVTPSNACGNGPSRSLPVTVYPPPQVSINPQHATICDGDFVLLRAETADTGVSFRWKYGNYDVPSGIQDSLEAFLAGVYSVVVSRTQLDHCADSAAPVTVDFIPGVRPEIQQRNNILYATSGLSGYQWYMGNQQLAGATDSVLVPVQEGLYRVRTADTSGCMLFSEPYRIEESHLGIINFRSEHLKIYPNPAVTEVHIKAETPVSVVLYDMEGKNIGRKSGTAVTFDINNLPAGIYMLRVTGTDGTLLRNEKLIKQSR